MLLLEAQTAQDKTRSLKQQKAVIYLMDVCSGRSEEISPKTKTHFAPKRAETFNIQNKRVTCFTLQTWPCIFLNQKIKKIKNGVDPIKLIDDLQF